MRRAIACILLLAVFCSTAYAEDVFFRGIPWLSSIDDVFNEIGILDAETVEPSKDNVKQLFMSYDNTIDGFGALVLDDWESYNDAGYSYTPYMICPDLDVAGYKVTWLDLQFMYSIEDGNVLTDKDHAQFISGKYQIRPEDYQAAYEDLRDKLIWLYGEPVTEESDKFGFDQKGTKRYSIWQGNNGASILLFVKFHKENTTLSMNSLTIEYAKTDAVEQLELLQKASEMRERDEKYNAENTNGL